MLRLTIALLLISAWGGCQTPGSPVSTPGLPAGVTYEGGDGSSIQNAAIVKGARESTGVQAEYAWLAQRFPGYRVGKQSLRQNGGKMYDVFEITTREGATKAIYFDISDYYEKY